MISVYEQRGIEKGIEQGIEQGIEEGIERGKRQTLLRLMAVKFRELPKTLSEYIETQASSEEVDRLTDTVIRASILEEMGLAQY